MPDDPDVVEAVQATKSVDVTIGRLEDDARFEFGDKATLTGNTELGGEVGFDVSDGGDVHDMESGDVGDEKLEFAEDAEVDAASGEEIGHGILVIIDTGDPVITVHVVDVEQIECIDTEPYILEVLSNARLDVVFLVVKETVTHANVHTPIGGGTENLLLSAAMGRTERQTVGIVGTEIHFPPIRVGEVVAEVE